jgi:hypothetical protein
VSEQPWITDWPMWEEPLSKVTAPLDVAGARWRLAKRFNARPPVIPTAVKEREVESAWVQHWKSRA